MTLRPLLSIALLATSVGAQSDRTISGAVPRDTSAARRSALSEYEGIYAYQGGVQLAIVAADTLLFAVIDEAKYPLRPLGADRIVNGVGDTIPFRRAADGAISGFVERGVFFPRLTAVVDPAIARSLLAVARPRGKDGRPERYVYAMPQQLADGLAVGTVTQIGIDTASVARMINKVIDGTYPDVHSFLVYRAGRLVVEEYFYDYDRDRPHQMRSASKSIVSALAGIAIDHGFLSGDRELVIKRLPYDSYANPDPRKDNLVLADLLTMQSGFTCDDWNGSSPGNESRVYQSTDWVKYVLDLPMADQPGTKGSYCSGNVAIIGRIVERATGKPLPVFAQEMLFTPLGIRANDVRWNYTLSSSNAATFAQLYLRPRDMLKLGILFQQKGVWQGRQIISRDWVERSTARHSTLGDQQYGYFWWHQWFNAATANGPRRVDMVAATGNGGQKIYIIPELDAVVVMTAGNYNTRSPAAAIMINDVLPGLLVSARASR